MRSTLSLFDFGLVIFALVALLHAQGTNAQPEEMCDPKNCMERHKCEMIASTLGCKNRADTCCSLVRNEYRSFCRQWGGECMDRCPESLTQRSNTECKEPQKCCILV